MLLNQGLAFAGSHLPELNCPVRLPRMLACNPKPLATCALDVPGRLANFTASGLNSASNLLRCV